MAKGRMTSFPTSQGTASGYLSTQGPGRPGVVVIQEWWGLVPHIKDVADRLANEGYTALAPDLYHGKSTVEEAEANHLMQGLDWSRAVGELSGAVEHLRKQENAPRVGVVGFCMGGALTILAAQNPGVDAYAAFYGFPPDASQLKDITAPGLIFFGEHEGFFSVPTAKAFAEAQQKRGRPTELIVYPKAGHAFFNDTRPEAYREDAARSAWGKTLDLFRRHLTN